MLLRKKKIKSERDFPWAGKSVATVKTFWNGKLVASRDLFFPHICVVYIFSFPKVTALLRLVRCMYKVIQSK